MSIASLRPLSLTRVLLGRHGEGKREKEDSPCGELGHVYGYDTASSMKVPHGR
jgi:hypothetical protein